MAKLFVCYSRKDSIAARKIMQALNAIGQDVWVDWEDIPPAVDWLEQIFRGIEASDAFIFLISPDSAASEVCTVEVRHAAKNNKRIIPVVLRQVDPRDTDSFIRQLNWTFMREEDKFDEGIARIKFAIELDFEWVEEHSRLQQRALEWQRRNGEPSLLLRGADLRSAEQMVEQAIQLKKEPQPTELIKEYLTRARRGTLTGLFRNLTPASSPSNSAKVSQTSTATDAAAQPPRQPVEVGKLFSVSTDQSSGADQLNYARFADAFATMIRNPEAKTPITIGVYGQWGSGKSFLMKKIIEALKGQPVDNPKTLFGRFANWASRLRKKPEQKVETIVIEFNAWVYSGSEHLWASLVTHLYREIERYFGIHAHYHRLVKAFRRFIPKTAGIFLFYAIPALLLSLVFGFDVIQKNWEATNIALKAVGASVVGGSLLATLPMLWSALREFADTLFMSRAMNLQKLAAKPDFRDQIGIMADIKSEIAFIGQLLETRNKRQQTRVVLFIDDLDRCEHRKAVEVLQAIMLLLADRDGSPFVIFLGIDARVIVKAIEEHYGRVLVDAGINGYEYLDKIVQVPFVIPSASQPDIRNYVDSLIWTKAEKELVEAKFAPKQKETTPKPSEPVSIQSSTTTQPNLQPLPANDPIPDVATESVPVTFTKPEREALWACSNDIVDNPRKIKRIINIYRLVRLLLPSDFQEHQKIIRWILLTEQWPLHAAWIVEEIGNDHLLQGKLSKKQGATILDVYHQVKDNIYSDDMDPLMTIDADPIKFHQFIQKEPIFTVEEISGLLFRYTFNLNPAIKSEISKYTAKMAENYIQIKVKGSRKPKNQKSAIEPKELQSASVKKAIQTITETATPVQ